MRVEKSNNVSFQSFKVDDKGKRVLKRLGKETMEDAMPKFKELLIDFKNQMDVFAQSLEENGKTKGTDLILTETVSDATRWAGAPALIFKKNKKVVSAPLYLDNFMTRNDGISLNEEGIINKFNLTNDYIKEWFNKNFKELTAEKPKKITPQEIVNGIFG